MDDHDLGELRTARRSGRTASRECVHSMGGLTLLPGDWRDHLRQLVSQAEAGLVISSPYVTAEGVQFVAQNLSAHFRMEGTISILTDLSPVSIARGSTDPKALRSLIQAVPSVELSHLPRLHAKVYIADSTVGIVTSANLTDGGLVQNHEYGVEITEPSSVHLLRRDLTASAHLGARVSSHRLATYCDMADRVRVAFRRHEGMMSKAVRREFERALKDAEDNLIRLRLEGGAVHTVFRNTIVYLLERYGPLTTVGLHPLVKRIHPDLCDESIDRVIDGKRFGKKWKHAVRTAQQELKRRGLIRLHRGRWELIAAPA